ncbi:hypothetical protein [Roseiarcus fermentans]|jgi:hypothetical protein|uniref:hypothetical protein n=1 Tax=Roseiarcus fermentans TaxID=1473586 RepID=UPI001AECC3B1|nr:hypothetical protein [Roseiarcus fermentans]
MVAPPSARLAASLLDLSKLPKGKLHSLQTGRFCITLVADQGAERGKPSWRQPQRISPGGLFRRGGKEAP